MTVAPDQPLSTKPIEFSAAVVIFDLDGTLIHTAPDLARAVNLMREDLGMAGFSEIQIMDWVGNGASRLVKRALTESWDGEPDPELFTKAYALFQQHYLDGVCEHSRPYPDVLEALEELSQRGFRLACVTNKPERFTGPLLDALKLTHYFEAVVCGDSLAEKKPHPLPLVHLCKQTGVRVEQAVLVGDSVNDIKAARAAGMPVICVSYGYNQGVDLVKLEPDAIIDSFKELSGLLQQPLGSPGP